MIPTINFGFPSSFLFSLGWSVFLFCVCKSCKPNTHVCTHFNRWINRQLNQLHRGAQTCVRRAHFRSERDTHFDATQNLLSWMSAALQQYYIPASRNFPMAVAAENVTSIVWMRTQIHCTNYTKSLLTFKNLPFCALYTPIEGDVAAGLSC